MSTDGLTDKDELSGMIQAKFCAEWSLRNIFRENPERSESIAFDAAVSQTQTEDKASPTSEPKSSSINVMLNTLDGTGHWKISEDGLTIRNDGSTFESIRATLSVSQGKWLYEVTLITAGIMQLGWATVHCHFSPEDGTGIGDDVFGFAYDGCRNLIWADGDSEPYGGSEPWKSGDVLGVYLDVDNAFMECFINGKSLGTTSPFDKDHFAIQAKSGFFPALSCTSFQQATVNFGATPFKFPPALPWRNLNDYGTISPETRRAIVRPRNDSVYGRIQVDPLTGIRLPSMPEGENEIDYSLLPLCRSRIFQRQMFQNNESEDTTASGGLGISGIASDASSASTSLPGLSASSTTTSTWSTEYCGPAPPSIPTSTTSNSAQGSSSDTAASTTATAAAEAEMTATAAAAAVIAAATAYNRTNSSESITTRRRNTLAAPSPTSRVALEMDCLSDPFSPPSTAYFSFLNRPPRVQRSHLHHSMEMDSVDPLQESTGSESDIGPLEMGGMGHGLGLNVDSSVTATLAESPTMDVISESEDEDPSGMDVVLVEEGREASGSEVMEHSAIDFPDGNPIHSRRSSTQVLSFPPPPPSSSSSLAPIVSTPSPTSPISAAAMNAALSNIASAISSSNSIMSNASGFPPVAATIVPGMDMGMNSGVGHSKFGGRRASMPCNRLEM
ncbi:RING finger and SPRY domain-containing protein 1 [Mortierella sp. AD010]|nr:RING finger and SPRY domain-containing protein 1 [Mortierella sp. AD010]